MNKLKPQHLVIVAILLVVALVALPQLLTERPGAQSIREGVVTQVIGVLDTDATATFRVQLLEGSDAEHESIHIFEAIGGLPGIGEASLDTATLDLTIAYDSSAISDATIREQLMFSGYVVPTAADATPAELAADGSTQQLAISDDGMGFEPFLISASAGIPIELEYAPGQECRFQVKFPALGIEQDISQGGTVSLPALDPGEYQIVCSGDGLEGMLFVE